jgi:hypothetical protein
MSNFTEVRIDLQDLGMIKKALLAMGYAEGQVELHSEPQTCNGYGGQTKKAQLIIRKKDISASPFAKSNSYGDIGFLQKADGSVVFVTDTDFRRQAFMNQLVDEYALAVTEQKIVNSGFFIESIDRQEGQIEVILDNPYQ